MHPLRFHNSSIRAKVYVRKIGFKQFVMRLNCIESFYALLLHFRSKGSKERGWPTMARPSTRVVGYGQAPYKGDRPWAGHPQGGDRMWPRPHAGVATRRSSRLRHDARRGYRLQHDARRSGDLQRGACPQRRLPTGTVPVGGPVDQVAARGGVTSL
ncbi:hypothetical protein BHE74_00036116 [Ensete ventricosum]|nr:hypothetical protein GW17_00040245 [Ensete ventricosum]RWW57115.1 hypothetical protein BHE74_00036116 [Ensete ventricosum]